MNSGRFPPPWSIDELESVLPPSATTRFNPRANDVSDYGWDGGIGAGEDGGCYRLGLVGLGVPFWPLKYATHIGDSSLR